MSKKFQVPKAKPDTEASMCEYMSLCDNSLPCNVEPSECVLNIIGHVSKDGSVFTPIKPQRRKCPKLNHKLSVLLAPKL